jgi:ABC-type phosphate/phosphonate transport system substrate-binding protein
MNQGDEIMAIKFTYWWLSIRRIHSPLLAICIIVSLLQWTLLDTVAAGQDDDMPKVFRAGFLQRVFLDTDPRDAKAALEVNGREVSRAMGLTASPSVVMFSDMASMAEAVRRGELELATMPTIEYLRIRGTVPLIPSFVGANNNGQGQRYVVIVRKDSGIRSFSDLKGKSVLLPLLSRHELGHLWLEVLLMQAGKGGPDSFFRQVRESPKVSHAIMGVFFRQADAAVVTRTGLDTSRQLNPQLETQLTIVAESGNLSDGVTCLIPTTPEKFRNSLYRAIMHLNESSSGRQMYTIFQSSGVTPFKASYLEGLEELLREQSRLKTKSAKRKLI